MARDLQPPLHTVLQQAPGSCATILQSPDVKHPTILCHLVRPFVFLSSGPRCPVLQISRHIILGNLRLPMGSSAPCPRLLDAPPTIAGGRIRKRGCCGCSTTCTRLRGFEAGLAERSLLCIDPQEGSYGEPAPTTISGSTIRVFRWCCSEWPSARRTVSASNVWSSSQYYSAKITKMAGLDCAVIGDSLSTFKHTKNKK